MEKTFPKLLTSTSLSTRWTWQEAQRAPSLSQNQSSWMWSKCWSWRWRAGWMGKRSLVLSTVWPRRRLLKRRQFLQMSPFWYKVKFLDRLLFHFAKRSSAPPVAASETEIHPEGKFVSGEEAVLIVHFRANPEPIELTWWRPFICLFSIFFWSF